MRHADLRKQVVLALDSGRPAELSASDEAPSTGRKRTGTLSAFTDLAHTSEEELVDIIGDCARLGRSVILTRKCVSLICLRLLTYCALW